MSQSPLPPDPPKAARPMVTVDWTYALEAMGGDESLLREVAEAYLVESPRQLAMIQSAIAARDAKQLRLAAHTIKGSTRYFGALAVVDVAYELETIALHAIDHGGTLDGAPALAVQLTELVAQLTPLMAEYIRRGRR